MNVELRDIIAVLSVLVAIITMVVVSRNARNATAVNAQSLDLARIRDLRSELAEAEQRLASARKQVDELLDRLTEANDRAITSARREAEMLRYARMPGTTMQDWLRRFDPDGTHEIVAQ